MVFANLLAVAGLLGALATFWLSLRSEKRRRLVRDIPYIPTNAVFVGMVKVQGRVESPIPLTSHVEGRTCVAYEWGVEERWSRLVTTWETDANGRQREVTRRETGWTPVAGGDQRRPFALRDKAGALRVNPDGADLQMESFAFVTCGPGSRYYGYGPAFAVPDSDYVRRVSESGVPLHATVNVVGYARERTDIVAPEIAKDDAEAMFLISVHSERVIATRYAFGSVGYLLSTLILAAGGWGLRDVVLEVTYGKTVWDYLVPVGIVVVPAYLLGLGLMVFNSLVALREMVTRGGANVEVQLKRRHDLLGNLTTVVSAYAEHEREVQERISAAMRAPTEVSGAAAALTPSVLLLAERYPDLRADRLFQDLHKRLSDTEDRIALARAYYLDVATAFNTRLGMVPDGVIGRLGGLRRVPAPVDGGWEPGVRAVTFTESV